MARTAVSQRRPDELVRRRGAVVTDTGGDLHRTTARTPCDQCLTFRHTPAARPWGRQPAPDMFGMHGGGRGRHRTRTLPDRAPEHETPAAAPGRPPLAVRTPPRRAPRRVHPRHALFAPFDNNAHLYTTRSGLRAGTRATRRRSYASPPYRLLSHSHPSSGARCRARAREIESHRESPAATCAGLAGPNGRPGA